MRRTDGTGAYTIATSIASAVPFTIPYSAVQCSGAVNGIANNMGGYVGVSVDAGQILSAGASSRLRARSLKRSKHSKVRQDLSSEL